MADIASFLSGGGSYLKWEMPGTKYAGTITNVELRQARKFESTELDTWDDGSPKMQVVLTLATDLRDPAIEDDDGTRNLSINLWSGQKKALAQACKDAGVKQPEVGQRFTAEHVSGIGTAKSPREFRYTLTAADLSGVIGTAEATATEALANVDVNDPAVAALLAKLAGK